ncbi:hypothetical protein ACEWY4_012571 [Coilia grayii]|uniref:Integrase zinc-binding domain-containing protein n=1 Tax=Coilia grayii TaxID=363190 RepID=A0ABD1K0Y5_9TELE
MLNEEMKTLGGQCISLDDLMRAEKAIVVFYQHQRYPEELARLKNAASGDGLSHKSTIYRLDPVLEDGVLRVGGRLSRAAMPEEAKRPMILPKDLHVSTLILRHIHEQFGHAGRNHVLSQLRKRFWIVNANSAAPKIMSVERGPPWSDVRYRDSREGMLDPRICRGRVNRAKKELQNAISTWNKEKIHNAMLQKGIQWSLNPPAASHHGGVWERLIRMVMGVKVFRGAKLTLVEGVSELAHTIIDRE